MKQSAIVVGILMLFCSQLLFSQEIKKAEATAAKNNQLVLWTSGDKEAAIKMVLMYTYNCKKRGWMDSVRLLIWGPSAKLLSEDSTLQAELKDIKQAGVELYACKACADLYKVSDKLNELGVTVMYTGEMLADLQKRGWHVITI